MAAAGIAVGLGVAGCRSASSIAAIVGVGAATATAAVGRSRLVADVGNGVCAPAGAVSLRHPASAAMPISSAIAIRQRLIYDR